MDGRGGLTKPLIAKTIEALWGAHAQP